eukprot:2952274-Heterocapsa_arctica.AAC.1
MRGSTTTRRCRVGGVPGHPQPSGGWNTDDAVHRGFDKDGRAGDRGAGRAREQYQENRGGCDKYCRDHDEAPEARPHEDRDNIGEHREHRQHGKGNGCDPLQRDVQLCRQGDGHFQRQDPED